ncbi:MAG TPA: hydrogenase maturation protease [Acidobacteriaceae bacterium]|nr:hydrogenase maturation protease [Acidobacteriaceae bacterium]
MAAHASSPALPSRRAKAAKARTLPAGGPALLLACGNSLRQDDAIGLRIAEAAEHLMPAGQLRIVSAQQFTPEMAADLAATELAIFVDASATDEPGAIRFEPVEASAEAPDSHRLDPPALLALAQRLCGHVPAQSFALTVGASHFDYGEEISGPLRQSIPCAVRLVKNLVSAFRKRA